MKALKQLLLVVIATAGLVFLLKWSSDNFGFRSVTFAFLVNWLIMAWIALLGQVWVFTYPPRYFAIKAFEKDGRLYEKLGIVLFKNLVRRGPLSIFSPTLHFSGGSEAIPKLNFEMCKAEAGHLTIFLVMLLFAGIAMVRGWFDAAGWMLLFSVILNGYPIMLQRYNRIRLQQILNKQTKKPRQ
jgi:hypothetical protein